MSWFGNKKARPSRTQAIRSTETWAARLARVSRDRGAIARLGVTFLAGLLLLAAMESWRVPFSYRVDDYVIHGIASRLQFERVNVNETERQRREAEARAPYIFRNNPESLDPLPQQLRADLGAILAADTLDDVPLDARRAFGLLTSVEQAPDGRIGFVPRTEEEVRERFNALKSVLAREGQQTSESRLEDIVSEFGKFIVPLSQHGVIDPRDVETLQIRRNSSLRIIPSDPQEKPEDVLLSQVRLSDQLSEAGDLGKSENWLLHPHLTEEIQPALKHWLLTQTPPTLQYDQAATKAAQAAARDSVEVVLDRYNEGELLVRPQSVLTAEDVELLRAEYDAVARTTTLQQNILRMIVVVVLVFVLALLLGFYIVRNQWGVVRDWRRFIVFLSAIVLSVFLGRMLSRYTWQAEVIPLVATVMLFAIAYDQILATLVAFTLCLLLTLSTTNSLVYFVLLMSTCTSAIVPLARISTRMAVIKVSLIAAVTYFLVSTGMHIVQTQDIDPLLEDFHLLKLSLIGAGMVLFCGYLVQGSLPLAESLFDVVTDISLLELSDPSHPLLQELVRRAPGTYNHSIAVASMAEAAAEAIGANGLLCRIGAYFHDVGKMLKPEYFVENMHAGDPSRHANLAPAMSTLIIIGHVKDGVDLAEQHNLPQPLVDFIEQHHGTTLVEYFYHAATKQAERKPDHRTDAEESSFRYPGPKPQTKETGVLMLADCCESASRALTDPTPKRLESLVHELTLKRLLDGQFDECSLTLSEIATIERSLAKSLIANYHGRIKYPEAKPAPAPPPSAKPAPQPVAPS